MKILVIRFSSIGDIVLTTPVVRCLKQQLPGVELHYLTKPAFAGILEPNPYIDKVILLKARLKQTIRALKAEGYDMVVDLHHNQRSWLVKQRLGVMAQSFNKLNLEKWLLVNLKVNKLPNVHIVDRYLETVKHLGVTNDGKGLDYFIPPDDEVELNTLPEAFRSGYAALVIGAKHNTKKLPVEKLIELCNSIRTPIVLLGGPEDLPVAEQIAKATTATLYNAVGGYKLAGSASLVRQASLVITHDTGLMHIAAAFKKPVVSVWGNTVPAFGMYPYFGDERPVVDLRAEVKNLKCRPCSKIGFQNCPKGHFNCMNKQKLEPIAQAANSQLP